MKNQKARATISTIVPRGSVSLCAAATAVALCAGAPAFAAPMVFTNQAAWEAALAGAAVMTEDFEASPLGTLAVGTTDLGKFSITIDQNADGNNEIRNSGSINSSRELQGDLDEGGLVMRFDAFTGAPIIGFAGTWASTTTGDRLTITVNSTTFEFDNYLTTGGGAGFLGIVDFAGFTEINFGRESISSIGEAFQLDNALIARAPAPATLALLGVALFSLAGYRRKGS